MCTNYSQISLMFFICSRKKVIKNKSNNKNTVFYVVVFYFSPPPLSFLYSPLPSFSFFCYTFVQVITALIKERKKTEKRKEIKEEEKKGKTNFFWNKNICVCYFKPKKKMKKWTILWKFEMKRCSFLVLLKLFSFYIFSII